MNFLLKNDEFCIKNEELCATIDEFCRFTERAAWIQKEYKCQVLLEFSINDAERIENCP